MQSDVFPSLTVRFRQHSFRGLGTVSRQGKCKLQRSQGSFALEPRPGIYGRKDLPDEAAFAKALGENEF
jgi:hypothetical protein